MLSIEPPAGPAPIVQVIDHATKRVDLNVYDITSKAVAGAMRRACDRGVSFRVMFETHPYHAMGLVDKEKRLLRATCASVKSPPERFHQKYVFDHAKYVVADPEISPHAAVGTANFSWSAFHKNREYIWSTRKPATVASLEKVFNADWNRQKAPKSVRKTLVVSPKSGSVMRGIINQKGPISMEQEEVGGPKSVLHAIAEKGQQARLIVPDSINSYDQKRVDALMKAGVQVRTIHKPFMHAKMIIGRTFGFVGSQNLSKSSIMKNREIGVAFRQKEPMQKLRAVFEHDWKNAQKYSR